MQRFVDRAGITFALGLASVALGAAPLDFSFLGCYGKASTPVSAAPVGATDPQVIKISPGTTYVDEPCHHFIAEFSISSTSGSQVPNISSNHKYSFDSKSNEAIDTQAACESYEQTTLVIRKKSGSSKWKFEGYSAFSGHWSNGKCTFSTQQTDFRKKGLFRPSSGTDKIRVASRVLTGPSSSQVPHTVCVGMHWANIEGVLQESCADPSR